MCSNEERRILFMLREKNTRDHGFRLLMNRYKEKIYWYIRRLVVTHEDAEDILQETFINVYRYAGNFRGESKIFTWLCKIATNECIRNFKKNNKELQKVEMTKMVVDNFQTGNSEGEDAILMKFQKAVLQLSEKQRIVFNMRYYEDLSYKEMADILNSSESALKTNYHYAIGKIKSYIKETE